MRSLTSLFVLIFCLQFISILSQQQSIVGTWSNPLISDNSGSACCVPDSIKVERQGEARWIAKYDYNGMLSTKQNIKCINFFQLTSAELNLAQSSSGNYDATLEASLRTPRYQTYFTYQIIGSTLKVQFHSAYYSYGCNFTFMKYNSFVLLTWTNAFFLFIVLIIVYGVWKKNRAKQVKKIAQENEDVSDQIPHVTTLGVQNTGYVAPVMMYNQAYPQVYAMPQPMIAAQPQFYVQPQIQPQPQPQAQTYVQPKPVPQPRSAITTTVNNTPKNYQF